MTEFAARLFLLIMGAIFLLVATGYSIYKDQRKDGLRKTTAPNGDTIFVDRKGKERIRINPNPPRESVVNAEIISKDRAH
jgi:hypothetical protein